MPDANYMRLRSSDTWHFHPACQHYKALLTESFVSKYRGKSDKPTYGELCDECMALWKEEEIFP